MCTDCVKTIRYTRNPHTMNGRPADKMANEICSINLTRPFRDRRRPRRRSRARRS